eukprot:GDKH01011346.1.p2 GENE.GDKH01011346.1~~GDKH01011346.1.p2  ORF type:complete len:56 (-),score=6.86 GDKH01011346.1:39-206(-)
MTWLMASAQLRMFLGEIGDLRERDAEVSLVSWVCSAGRLRYGGLLVWCYGALGVG